MHWQTAFIAARGLLYASGFVALWVWVAVTVMPFDAAIPFSVPLYLRLAGYPIAIAGAALTLWCIGSFIFRGRGTPAPFDPPRELVAGGPYRFSRNPMYVGALSLILGVGLAIGSVSISGLAVVFGLAAHVFVLVYEEPALERQFGDTYRRYRETTNRWLPWPKGHREGPQ